MTTHVKRPEISIQELMNHSCDVSQTLKSLVKDIQERMPYLKLDYVYVNTKDPLDRIQVMLLYKFDADNGNGTITKYLVYIANSFSFSSLDGYAICKERGQLDEWFEDFKDRPVVYPEMFLKDIINRSDDLVFYRRDDPDKYWKDPKNAKKVAEQLDDYSSSFHSTAPRR